jgi:DNA repair protein RAD16
MPPRKATSLSKRSTTVPDSDQDTSDQDQIPIATTRNRSKSQVQVVIPVMSSRAKAARRSNSPSSLSSANSRDVQSIDTPATSAGVTPEPSVRGRPGNKRKRETDDDAAIAQQLQEEEWAEVAQPSKKIKAEPVDTKKSRRSYEAVVIEDSDGEDMSDLSSAMSFKPEGDSEDEFAFKKPKGKAARQTVVETDEDEPLKYKSRLSKARAGKKPVVPQQRNSVVIPDSDSELSTFSELDEVDLPTEDEFRSQDAQSGAADSTDEEDDQPLALTNIRRRRGQANLQGRDLGAEIKIRRVCPERTVRD